MVQQERHGTVIFAIRLSAVSWGESFVGREHHGRPRGTTDQGTTDATCRPAMILFLLILPLTMQGCEERAQEGIRSSYIYLFFTSLPGIIFQRKKNHIDLLSEADIRPRNIARSESSTIDLE